MFSQGAAMSGSFLLTVISVPVQLYPVQYTYNFSTINRPSPTTDESNCYREFTTLASPIAATSSFLFDGIIPPLIVIDGNVVSSELLILRSSSATIAIDFFGSLNNAIVRRIEVVFLNCKQLRASIGNITLMYGSNVQIIDTSDRTSCSSLQTICVPGLTFSSSSLSMHLVTADPLDLVYLAEVKFYEEGSFCTPVIVTPTNTTNIGGGLCYIGEPPSFVPNGEPPANFVVNTQFGNNLILPCWVAGTPAPSVSWFKEGSEIDAQFVMPDGTLTLRVTENEIPHQGIIYYCIATNRIGQGSLTIASLRSRDVNVTLSCE